MDARQSNERLIHLLRDLRTELHRIYGSRLKGAYLYGSYARHEADPESDVDILVVLDDIERYGDEVTRTGSMGSALSLKYGISVSQVFVTERAWSLGDTAFLGNVREEAVPA